MEMAMKLKLNQVEVEFNLYNANTAEIYEKGNREVMEVSEEAMKCDSLAEAIRKEYTAIVGLFDALFGEGKGTEICGTEPDLNPCLDAYEALVGCAFQQQENMKKRSSRANRKYAVKK